MATRFNWYSATPNHLWLSLNISHVPSVVTVNTIAECLRTDCNILGDNNEKKSGLICQTHSQLATQVILIWGGFLSDLLHTFCMSAQLQMCCMSSQTQMCCMCEQLQMCCISAQTQMCCMSAQTQMCCMSARLQMCCMSAQLQMCCISSQT